MAVISHARPLSLDDYLALPLAEDAGREQEIIRGTLYVSPRPGPLHQGCWPTSIISRSGTCSAGESGGSS
jgi:hypothetical protein